MIVKLVLQHFREGNEVSVHATDTDIFMMLIHHWTDGMSNIYVKSSLAKRGYREWKQFNVSQASQTLKPKVRELILFIHAFSGCDTTSCLHEKGKSSMVKLIEKSAIAQEKAGVFCKMNASHEEIGKAGQTILVLLYGGDEKDTLATFRHRLYMKMAASASKINPAKLPPTDRAAYFQSLCVFLQVIRLYRFCFDNY